MPPATASLRLRAVHVRETGRVEQRVVQRVDADDDGEADVACSSWTKAGRSRGLVIRTLCAPIFTNMRLEVSAKTWYSGSGVTTTSSPSLQVARDPRRHLLHVGHQVAVRQDRALGHAGRAAGVLQEGDVVVRSAARRPAPARVPARNAALNAMAPAMLPVRHHVLHVLDDEVGQPAALTGGNMSPTSVVMTVMAQRRVAIEHLLQACARSSPAPRSPRRRSPSTGARSSRAVYCGLTLTTTRPARSAPNSATGYCSRLGSMMRHPVALAQPQRSCCR